MKLLNDQDYLIWSKIWGRNTRKFPNTLNFYSQVEPLYRYNGRKQLISIINILPYNIYYANGWH